MRWHGVCGPNNVQRIQAYGKSAPRASLLVLPEASLSLRHPLEHLVQRGFTHPHGISQHLDSRKDEAVSFVLGDNFFHPPKKVFLGARRVVLRHISRPTGGARDLEIE